MASTRATGVTRNDMICIPPSCRGLFRLVPPWLREPHLNIRPFLQMNAFNESHFAGLQSKDDRRSARAFAEEPYALKQRAIRHAGGGEDELLAGSEVFCFVNSVLIFDAHAGEALFLLRLYHQAAEHVAVEAADGGGGNHAFRRAARAHDGVDAGADYGSRNAG